jgi:hypothetical protein
MRKTGQRRSAWAVGVLIFAAWVLLTAAAWWVPFSTPDDPPPSAIAPIFRTSDGDSPIKQFARVLGIEPELVGDYPKIYPHP